MSKTTFTQSQEISSRMIDIFPALFDNYFIKIIFLVHATLLSLANVTNTNATAVVAAVSYTSYGIIFLLVILLSILTEDNANLLLVAAAFDAISVVLDVVFIVFVGHSQLNFLPIMFVILNLVCRPISTILLLKNYSAKAGVEDPTSGILEVNVPTAVVSRGRSAYHNIDEPNQSLP